MLSVPVSPLGHQYLHPSLLVGTPQSWKTLRQKGQIILQVWIMLAPELEETYQTQCFLHTSEKLRCHNFFFTLKRMPKHTQIPTP